MLRVVIIRWYRIRWFFSLICSFFKKKGSIHYICTKKEFKKGEKTVLLGESTYLLDSNHLILTFDARDV